VIAGYCWLASRAGQPAHARGLDREHAELPQPRQQRPARGDLQITVVIIIPFVLMGQLLMRSGGSNFFNDIAIALMGATAGGRRRMAVLGSSLFGMISGIAAANTVAVGVVTIPLMKRSGMPAKLAAAVEACASNGGQLMPR